jgi:subfamily B ATP-binding cassette protein HlyB/CyaB
MNWCGPIRFNKYFIFASQNAVLGSAHRKDFVRTRDDSCDELSMARNANSIAKDAAWLLSSFCALHQQAFDAALFSQSHPGTLGDQTFGEAARNLGLRLVAHSGSLKAVLARHLPLAALFRREPGDGEVNHASEWRVILNADEAQVAVIGPADTALRLIPMAEAEKRYLGRALAFTPETVTASDPDDLERRPGLFGLRWFVPELLKHKRIWRDVLLASLVLQLMALAIPLFTQVIIDKVIVHRTKSTLIALAIAMGVFLVFTSLLG